jgi:hypothetical chaperone protein
MRDVDGDKRVPGPVLGIDFGTTNTVIALAGPGGVSELVRFETPTGATRSAFRSVLSFGEPTPAARAGQIEGGPWAIDAFLEDPEVTRLVQSFKTFAASSAFSGTTIHGKRFQFEDLLAAFLRQARTRGGTELQVEPGRAILGRPVVFAGATPDESLALTRYASAFDRLGYVDRAFAYEPVGAAFFFAKRLAGRATVLVADFGGGTSDFSVMRFERQGGALSATPLSHSGVGVAGDAFDFRIIDEVVSPRLGKGGGYRSDGKVLGVPQRYYAAFARWNQLTLMKWSKDMREIKEIARTAIDPEALGRFIRLIENDHGYALYQSVSKVKEALSGAEAATLDFRVEDIDIQVEIRRTDFERWIGKELEAIQRAVDQALETAGVEAGQIDKVFLTGGSSLVPAVRRIFADRFGEAALETGGEFESIASGLALIGAEADPTPWIQQ